MGNVKPKKDDQVKQFRKAARELDCDQSEERFQKALRTVAKQKPQPNARKQRQTKS